MFRPTKILVPTDFSTYSDTAFAQALDLAKQYSATVYLFHVVDDYVQQCAVDYCLDTAVVEQLQQQIRQRGKEKMLQELGRFPQAKEVAVIVEVGHGNPYKAIIDEVTAQGIDLVVIASLGKSGVAHVIIGSVARHILREAKCSVLLTK